MGTVVYPLSRIARTTGRALRADIVDGGQRELTTVRDDREIYSAWI